MWYECRTMPDLLCHPSTPSDAVRAITAHAARTADARLVVSFQVDGDLPSIDVPPPRPQRFTHQLWEHTCFEAFIAEAGAGAYHELNFSPSGEWAGYAFRAYRDIAGLVAETLEPHIVLRIAPDRLELEATLVLERLSPAYRRAALRIGLSAVIEEIDGQRSYWALRHAPGQPDFHHADALALRLEPQDERC